MYFCHKNVAMSQLSLAFVIVDMLITEIISQDQTGVLILILLRRARNLHNIDFVYKFRPKLSKYGVRHVFPFH